MRDTSENFYNLHLRGQMSPKHALGNCMDVSHVPVDVVRAEDGEGNHEHVYDMVGEQGGGVAPQKLQ